MTSPIARPGINLLSGARPSLDTPDAPTRIAYVSAPFEEPVAVSGLITGELKAAINRKDFDFTWALYEAMPDGKYFNLSYYLGRASYAADRTTRRLLTPGKTTSLPFSRTPLTAKQLVERQPAAVAGDGKQESVRAGELRNWPGRQR